MTDKLLDTHIAAKRLGISRYALYEKIKRGEILAVNHNQGTNKRPWYSVTESALEEYLKKKITEKEFS